MLYSFLFLLLVLLLLSSKKGIGILNNQIIANNVSTLYPSEDDTLLLTGIAANLSDSKWSTYLNIIKEAWERAKLTQDTSLATCGGMFDSVMESDLLIWKERGGIKREEFVQALNLGVHYQIVNHSLYRQKQCMFGPRCQGVEHFILNIIHELPNMELIINVYDYPKVYKHHSPLPVFSFSKTSQYWDIMYPAWTFWSGGPAVSVEPRGLGRWDLKRNSITKAALHWPWVSKKTVVFFRGSRTSSERDPLVLLSRDKPHLVDAAYTKNQAWKSPKDTLGAPPANEVKLEDHCQYLVNFRGVAASFRFKHLFLCRSLVLHSGHEWVEFFYSALLPWVHYIPLPADQEGIESIVKFVIDNDGVAKTIADRGFQLIWHHLNQQDVQCYWKKLLLEYSKLLKWTVSSLPTERSDFIKID